MLEPYHSSAVVKDNTVVIDDNSSRSKFGSYFITDVKENGNVIK